MSVSVASPGRCPNCSSVLQGEADPLQPLSVSCSVCLHLHLRERLWRLAAADKNVLHGRVSSQLCSLSASTCITKHAGAEAARRFACASGAACHDGAYPLPSEDCPLLQVIGCEHLFDTSICWLASLALSGPLRQNPYYQREEGKIQFQIKK